MKIVGETGDILNLCQLGWFEGRYFRDRNNFPYQEEKVGRYLGAAANCTNEISQYILKDTMCITISHTVRVLTADEYRELNITCDKEQFMVKCQS